MIATCEHSSSPVRTSANAPGSRPNLGLSRPTQGPADDVGQYSLRVARITYQQGENNRALIVHLLDQMQMPMEAIRATDISRQEDDTDHLGATARTGSNRETSVVDADCRSRDTPNLWICDGSVFPTVGGVNPALTIQQSQFARLHGLAHLLATVPFERD